MPKTKKKPAKKAAAKAPSFAPRPVRITPASKARSKGELYRTMADAAGISRKQAVAAVDTLTQLLAADLAKGGGVFNLFGLAKMVVVKKPAVPAREGKNPFTGEMQMFKAKPARKVVKIRPMKALKSLVM
jgi:nucleoid DNA-binding protein